MRKQLRHSVLVTRPLKGFKSFARVFTHGHKVYSGALTAFVEFSEIDPATPDTLGNIFCEVGVAAKRRTRPAVMRNRIKRLLRHAVREVVVESAIFGMVHASEKGVANGFIGENFSDIEQNLLEHADTTLEKRLIFRVPTRCVLVWNDIPAHPMMLRLGTVLVPTREVWKRIERMATRQHLKR